MIRTAFRVALVAGAGASLAGCQPRIASMSCEDIAREAQRIWSESENQPVRVTQIRNAREVSRNENEARCSGEATLSDNSTSPINMRAYKADNGSVMVESGGGPFPN